MSFAGTTRTERVAVAASAFVVVVGACTSGGADDGPPELTSASDALPCILRGEEFADAVVDELEAPPSQSLDEVLLGFATNHQIFRSDDELSTDPEVVIDEDAAVAIYRDTENTPRLHLSLRHDGTVWRAKEVVIC